MASHLTDETVNQNSRRTSIKNNLSSVDLEIVSKIGNGFKCEQERDRQVYAVRYVKQLVPIQKHLGSVDAHRHQAGETGYDQEDVRDPFFKPKTFFYGPHRPTQLPMHHMLNSFRKFVRSLISEISCVSSANKSAKMPNDSLALKLCFLANMADDMAAAFVTEKRA
uniref:Uncharacterized protein n=1 Tax=Romanomermis culicivorax TaxID=13658 RepID=A0A915K6U9_ROMCU